jgi:hypothetical protein
MPSSHAIGTVSNENYSAESRALIWGISEMAILPGEWNLRESQWL